MPNVAHRRRLPVDLEQQLQCAVEREAGAQSRGRRTEAIAETSLILLAAYDCGWRLVELAEAAGLQPSTVSARVRHARRSGRPMSIEVVAPPAPVGELPLDQREWLKAGDACAVAGVTYTTLRQWRECGLLPTSRRVTTRLYLYARADLDKIIAAPRLPNSGIDRRAVLATLAPYAGSPCRT